jgi:leucyl-tRNA synthetase
MLLIPILLSKVYGADTARLFSLFASPPERDLEWSDQGVDGSFRFLNRVWKLVHEHLETVRNAAPPVTATLTDEERTLRRAVHKTLKKVTEDIDERFHFNTAIAAVMELMNTLQAARLSTPQAAAVMKESLELVVTMLAPFVPHLSEELWQLIGHSSPLSATPWPAWDAEAVVDEELLIVVQVNGKLRSKLSVPAGIDEEAVKNLALADDKVKVFTDGMQIRKVIYVPGKLVNIVVG